MADDSLLVKEVMDEEWQRLSEENLELPQWRPRRETCTPFSGVSTWNYGFVDDGQNRIHSGLSVIMCCSVVDAWFVVLVVIFFIDLTVCRVFVWVSYMYDPRSYEIHAIFSKYEEKPKKFRTSTGFEPVTSWCRWEASSSMGYFRPKNLDPMCIYYNPENNGAGSA